MSLTAVDILGRVCYLRKDETNKISEKLKKIRAKTDIKISISHVSKNRGTESREKGRGPGPEKRTIKQGSTRAARST